MHKKHPVKLVLNSELLVKNCIGLVVIFFSLLLLAGRYYRCYCYRPFDYRCLLMVVGLWALVLQGTLRLLSFLLLLQQLQLVGVVFVVYLHIVH